MTIESQLTQLNTVKQDIKTAINGKGGSVGNNFSTYAAAITAIPSGGGGAIEYGKAEVITIKQANPAIVSITTNSFYGWEKPTGLIIEDGFSSIGTGAFREWTAAISLKVPASMRTIGQSAFQGWRAATSLTIENGVTSVGDSSFYNWIKCEELNLPNSLKTIAGAAFLAWSACKRLSIGNGLTSVATGGLRGMTKLESFTITAVTPPTVTPDSLHGIPATCVIKVPAASLAAYKAANYWSVYAAQIVAI